jgi:hypothetical protein
VKRPSDKKRILSSIRSDASRDELNALTPIREAAISSEEAVVAFTSRASVMHRATLELEDRAGGRQALWNAAHLIEGRGPAPFELPQGFAEKISAAVRSALDHLDAHRDGARRVLRVRSDGGGQLAIDRFDQEPAVERTPLHAIGGDLAPIISELRAALVLLPKDITASLVLRSFHQ